MTSGEGDDEEAAAVTSPGWIAAAMAVGVMKTVISGQAGVKVALML